MAISLQKGGNVSLTRTDPGLAKLHIGLGWDARATAGVAFDLDATVFLVKEDGMVRSDTDCIFYNNKKSTDGAVEHQGDNVTGAGDGDDEAVKVKLGGVAPDVKRLVFAVTIHEADTRRQTFGMVQNAFMRIVNDESNIELARFDLSEDFSTETAVIFGEVYRHNNEWKFKAVGQGFLGGLAALAKHHGVNI